MTLIPVYFAMYCIIAGITFRAVANTTTYPDDPWRTPGPFFAAMLWFIMLPALMGFKGGGMILGDGSERLGRDERRREKELAEAKHKQQLAKIEAATTRELERALEK